MDQKTDVFDIKSKKELSVKEIAEREVQRTMLPANLAHSIKEQYYVSISLGHSPDVFYAELEKRLACMAVSSVLDAFKGALESYTPPHRRS